MSYAARSPEELEIEELALQRRRELQLTLAMLFRNQRWARTLAFQREQQAAWIAADAHAQNLEQNRQLVQDRVPSYSLDMGFEHQSIPAEPFVGAESSPWYGDASDFESEHPDYENSNTIPADSSMAYDHLDEQRNDEEPRNPMANGMTMLGNNLRDIRMHSTRDGWKGLIATLDSGSEENWMSRKVVERLGLHVRSGLVLRYIMVDSRQFPSGETVQAAWTLEGSSQTHENEFRVAPREAPFDVLFGSNLLFSNEVNFDPEIHPVLSNKKKNVIPELDDEEKKEQSQTKVQHHAQADKVRETTGPQDVRNDYQDPGRRDPSEPQQAPREDRKHTATSSTNDSQQSHTTDDSTKRDGKPHKSSKHCSSQ